MKPQQIYYILLLMTIGWLTACQSDETKEQKAQESPVAFSPDMEVAQVTRVDGTYRNGTTFEEGDKIGVFGYYTEKSTFDAERDYPNFMYNQPVTLSSSEYWKYFWEYAPLKYWPNNANEYLSFIGYYPHDGTGISISFADNKGLPIIQFATQTTASSEIDLMVSDLKENCTHITNPDGEEDDLSNDVYRSVDARVPLLFHHALAQIRFYVYVEVVDGSEWDHRDKDGKQQLAIDLALSNVYTKGTLTLPATAIGTKTFSDTNEGGNCWSNRVFTLDDVPLTTTGYDYSGIAYDAEADRILLGNSTLHTKDIFFVIPQAATYTGKNTPPTLTVTVRDTRTGDIKNDNATYSAPLNGGTPLGTDTWEWRGGFIYNYWLKIRLDYTIWGYFLDKNYEAEQW